MLPLAKLPSSGMAEHPTAPADARGFQPHAAAPLPAASLRFSMPWLFSPSGKTLDALAPRLRKIDRGEPLSLAEIDGALARAHYSGAVDVFPGVDPRLRSRANGLATALLGGDEAAGYRARRLDFSYGLAQSFLSEDGKVLMEKVDVSDYGTRIPAMIKNALVALNRSHGGDGGFLSEHALGIGPYPELRALLNRLQAARQGCEQGLGLDYRRMMDLVHGYATTVGTFNEDGFYPRILSSQDRNDDSLLRLQPSEIFPIVLLDPSFDAIGIREYAAKILNRWPVGEHPLGLLEAFRSVSIDGKTRAALGRRFSAHDVGHSDDWRGAMRFDFGINAALPRGEYLRRYLEEKIRQMEWQLRFNRRVQQVANPRVVELAHLWCFHFGHEDNAKMTASLLENRYLDPVLAAWQACPTRNVRHYLEGVGFELSIFYSYVARDRRYAKLLSDPIDAWSFGEFLESLQVVRAAYEEETSL